MKAENHQNDGLKDSMNYMEVINHYYGEGDSELKSLLLKHSRAVADKALRICDKHPELGLDREFVEAAAMLHDIGIIRCDAPKIHCHGTEPYIRHGILGAEMLASPIWGGLEGISRICQRHTGAGITRAEVIAQQLPLPLTDGDFSAEEGCFSDGDFSTDGASEPYMPETLEEKIVCYADKFFSKTSPDHEKTLEEAERSLAKFGSDGVQRFREWARLFE